MIKHLKPRTEEEINANLKPGQSRRSWDIENIMNEFYIENLCNLFNVPVFRDKLKKNLAVLGFETKVEVKIERSGIEACISYQEEDSTLESKILRWEML